MPKNKIPGQSAGDKVAEYEEVPQEDVDAINATANVIREQDDRSEKLARRAGVKKAGFFAEEKINLAPPVRKKK